MNSLSSFLPNNEENEKKAIIYLLKNLEQIFQFNDEWFFNEFYHNCFLILREIKLNKYALSETLFIELYNKKYEKNETEAIKLLFYASLVAANVDIKYYLDSLNSYYVLNQIIVKSEDFFSYLVKENINANPENVLQQLKSIEFCLNENQQQQLFSFKDLAKNYRETHKKRREGESKKSIGSKELDKLITKPAAPQEMTVIVGRKGFGKSAFKTYLQNGLISKGVPVVSFELEMSDESNDDRFICSRSGLSLSTLVTKELDPRTEHIIEKEIQKLEKQKNYLRFKDPSLNLEKLDSLLALAVQKFQDAEVLGSDKYFVAFFDTLDIMEDFDDASPKKIKRNVNILHRLYRKYNAHFIPILQANENKFRGGHIFKKPEELDYYHVTLEDIEGGSAFAARSRVVVSINRPLQLKKAYFPERMEEWDLELDVLNVHGIKQNDGKLFFTQYTFEDNFRITPLKNVQ
jgi:replicative DNA helicase